MAGDPRLVFTLKDGREIETTHIPPYSVREQLDWEEHFGQSFMAIQQCIQEMRDASEQGRNVDPVHGLRTSWILWFGWQRARVARQVPAKFDKFIEELDDWTVVRADDADDDGDAGVNEPPAKTDDADDADALSVDPDGDEDGRLDPTATTEPSAPGQ